ncbi:quinolinate synthase NadA [bacterium]|nr:quinolinate synthase NadA [bacterium]
MLRTAGKNSHPDEAERKYRAEMTEKIAALKEKRNAVLLVHNYQRDEIQDIADIMGDSLGLARAAAETDKDVIVFCGVVFMAESASILNPRKTVLLPVKEAGCPLADMATVEELRKIKERFPDAAVVSYVNSSALVKAESDICCTSANAIKVVNSVKEDRIIFVPDRNLGRYVAGHTDKEIILWPGYCETHDRLRAADILECKKKYPDAEVIAHPECRTEVLELADAALSTSGMLRYAEGSKAGTIIVGTEIGMGYRLKRENPDKTFIFPSECLICETMKMTTLDAVHNALENMVHEIRVDEETRRKANIALTRMLEVV